MNDSVFDPNTLLNTQFTEPNSTEFIVIDAGNYTAVVTDLKARSGTIAKGDRQGERYISVDITWQIDDPSVKEKTGRDKNTVRQGLMIDLTPQGGFDMGKGKNVRLGRLRSALGLNEAGRPFSFEMLRGRMAKIAVVQRTDDREDSPNKGQMFNDVKDVAPLN